MRNSLEDWKRVPTTASTLFGVDLPYRPPKSAVGAYIWRRRMWIETTWGLSVLEPWEKILVLAFFYLLTTLVFTGVYKFVPHRGPLVYRRLLYYILGNEAEGAAGAMSVRHLVTDWARYNASIGPW
ncbi:hypothetical protein C2E23DRAFT_857683 [Lenzites betulinus]|nr:hypothetical protein C2E23DRAFT_857683 [Lenzites betulinus]